MRLSYGVVQTDRFGGFGLTDLMHFGGPKGLDNVPPSFRDVGAWERGNAHWGRVETPPIFGVFWGAGGASKYLSFNIRGHLLIY